MTALSGYRIMWMMVMFDLPVGTKDERYRATRFRNFLLDEGFEMAQFSIYMRYCAGRERVEAHARRIEQALPPSGAVQMVTITDKQYEGIIRFRSRKKQPAAKNPSQLALF